MYNSSQFPEELFLTCNFNFFQRISYAILVILITGFIIHNNTILQVKVIIFEFVPQIEKLLVLIDLGYGN